MYKIIAENIEPAQTAFLQQNLELLKQGYNIFQEPDAIIILDDLFQLKQNYGSKWKVFANDLLVNWNMFVKDIDPLSLEITDTEHAIVSIIHCLENLNENNRIIVLNKLARDFDILKFKNLKTLERQPGYLGYELITAVKNDEMEEVKELLEHGADVNAYDSEGFTSLLRASFKGYSPMISELLKVPAIDVNIRDYNAGWSALWIASVNGFTVLVEELLKQKNINVNLSDCNGMTPLMKAVAEGHTDVVKKLLQAEGILVDACNAGAVTALYIAKTYKRQEIVELLIQHGADTKFLHR